MLTLTLSCTGQGVFFHNELMNLIALQCALCPLTTSPATPRDTFLQLNAGVMAVDGAHQSTHRLPVAKDQLA